MTEVEQTQPGLGAILMRVIRSNVGDNGSLIMGLAWSSQTSAIKNSTKDYASKHLMNVFLIHRFVKHVSELLYMVILGRVL